MNCLETKIDDYNYSIILNNMEGKKIEIKKFKENNVLRYSLPTKSKEEYDLILDYLANIMNKKEVSQIYEDDGSFDETLYCYITDNIKVEYDLQTNKVLVEIKNDSNNENYYNILITNIMYNLSYPSTKMRNK